MPLSVLYFAWVRDAVGIDNEELDPPSDVSTVPELVRWLGSRDDKYAVLDGPKVRCALDQEFAAGNLSLAGVREVAFFPPVTGG